MAGISAAIDLGLLSRLTDLLLCSRCLRLGRRTPVPQVVSRRHRPRTLCPACHQAECGARDHPARTVTATDVVSDY
jgi:hypothetical protein